ncbi:hypothetical protein [Umezawaea tangerina]|uniref:hypothetical protein n=1 Tax=Umezawaea tangerina TaxID=84725 RepID=UPI001B8025F1
MKLVLPLAVLVLLGTTATAPVAEAGPLTTAHTVGRVTPTGHAVRYTWPGISFEGRFRGTGVGIALADGVNDYDVQVDGTTVATLVTPGRTTYWVGGLSPAVHDVRLVKRTESPWAEGEFDGFVAAPGGALLPPPRATATRPRPATARPPAAWTATPTRTCPSARSPRAGSAPTTRSPPSPAWAWCATTAAAVPTSTSAPPTTARPRTAAPGPSPARGIRRSSSWAWASTTSPRRWAPASGGRRKAWCRRTRRPTTGSWTTSAPGTAPTPRSSSAPPPRAGPRRSPTRPAGSSRSTTGGATAGCTTGTTTTPASTTSAATGTRRSPTTG